MKNLFILLLALLGCSGSNENKAKQQNETNVVIKSPEFRGVIKNFYKDAFYYSSYAKNDTISVSFYKYNESDKIINVGLYSFKTLEGKNIGIAELDNLKIFFYTENIDFTTDFIEVKRSKEKTSNKQYNRPTTYKETYEKFYTYDNGKLTLMKIK